MTFPRLDMLTQFLSSRDGLVVAVLWLGLAAFTIGVVILLWTRWGESQPLSKCMMLSVMAHVLLFGCMATVQIGAGGPSPIEPIFHVSLDDGLGPEQEGGATATGRATGDETPWEALPHDRVVMPSTPDAAREALDSPSELTRQGRAAPGSLPDAPALGHLALADAKPGEPGPVATETGLGHSSPAAAGEAIDAPSPQRRDAPAAPAPAIDSPRAETPATEVSLRPARGTPSGVPSALLVPLGPPPKVAETAPDAGPGEAAFGHADDLPRFGRPTAADALAGGSSGSRTSAGGDTAYTGAGPSDHTHVARLTGPSLGAGGSTGTTSGGGGRAGTVGGTGDGTGASGAGMIGPGGVGGTGSATGALIGPPRLPSGRPGSSGDRPLPALYGDRVAPDRPRIAQSRGATPETEAAVKAALKWLAGNQAENGRWDARQSGAGQERLVGTRDRQGAGIDADAGITGLALLAMLASGHTHREGDYRENVRRGLEYLMRVQAADGNLAGPATGFARMYCHAIATFAMSEAYGMTGEPRLEQPVRRAIAYSLAAQSPTTGGWRYAPGDSGDTSQLGWQLMALKSAELAGIAVPEATRQGAIRYLRSVSSGQHGGLASYRPSEQVTRPMTAEALVCWQFLGMPREHPAGNEAGDYILGDIPPGSGKPNLYYWYYATLGMYQLQGPHWQKWNVALRTTLVDSQRRTGTLAGSWDTDTVWGGYGGRVYTTALATLCLEVYYRFLPLYKQAAGKQP